MGTYTARFTAYAAAHGKSPEAMAAGGMAGFICWVGQSLRAWRKLTDCDARVLSDEQNAAFDAWAASQKVAA